jgi:flavin reductase (DIM6/NTAB) family NADH-FMN oxidoreductase RutF
VAVIATEWSGELFGATVNSLTSLQPCMLLFCTSEGSATQDQQDAQQHRLG